MASSHSEMNPLASSAVDRGLSGPQNDERHTEERFQRLRAKIEKYWLFRLTATGSTARSIARSGARRERGSIWVIVASPFEQAPNHDPQTIGENAPQAPENREHESVRNEFAG